MGSLRVESGLVGGVADLVGLAIITHIFVLSLDNDGSRLRSEGLQLSLLVLGDTIAGLNAVQK